MRGIVLYERPLNWVSRSFKKLSAIEHVDKNLQIFSALV